jgi:eukaryotic-like serine/threonine-protein kinase
MPGAAFDRYEFLAEIASGGMATVFLGRMRGGGGFARTVAIKRLHAHLAKDPHFVAMFLDEARLAAQIRHANVASTLDVFDDDGELFIVMDYVHGESLARIRDHLTDDGKTMPLPILGAILSGVLQGLHAAHEATSDKGEPLGIVHRDVSPQNILVGADGVARVVDFGVAKAADRVQTTADGQIKGKVAYMAPEQISGQADRRTDVFAASVVLWEMLAGRRLFVGETHAQTLANVLSGKVPALRDVLPGVSPAIEELVMCGLDVNPEGRYATARTMDRALHRCIPVGSSSDVAEWLRGAMGKDLEEKAAGMKAAIEGGKPAPQRLFPANRLDATAANIPTVVSEDGLPRKRRPRGTLGLFVAVAAAGVLVFRFGGLGAHATTAGGADQAATNAPAVLPVEPSVRTREASSASAPALAPSGESAAASIPASDSGVGSTSRPASLPTPQRGSKRSKCDPPYYIDSRGQHFKSECL